MKNIFIKESLEANNKKVLWLHFKCKDGSGAMLSLNNTAQDKTSITKKAMLMAIAEYIEDEKE